jgi:hypothetical protein
MDAPEQQPAETSEQPAVVLELKARYVLLDAGGKESASGEARLVLDDSSLGLKGEGKKARYIPLRDIYEMNAADYTITLELSTDEKLALSQLGHDYENFQRELALRRRDLTLSDLLMQEPLKMGGLHAAYRWLDVTGVEKQCGSCEMRLYQTALIIVPELNMPVRLPYSDLATVSKEDYKVIARAENGEQFIFEQMGRDLEPLARVLAELIQSLDLAVQALVKELMPSADLPSIRKLATLMKEGRAARRADIEAVGANLWAELEAHLSGSEAGDGYKFLKSLGQEQDICIGVKRGLKAGESDYLWFMVPLYAADAAKPGNAVIMEAISAEGESRATYVFRMVSRKEYPNFKTLSSLQAQMGSFIQTINHALVAINFRREPIYLTNEMLSRPQYEKYRYSIARIPELRSLRWLYTGRVIHATPEQWQADIKDLLAFNVSTQDDGKLWVKKEPEAAPPEAPDSPG